MTDAQVLVLGAGPAGLAAGHGLAERGYSIEIIERQPVVGGAAGSFEVAGLRVDYGSHRLHPAADPAVLESLRGLLGEDLLERPRHGRIRLLGRWLHFPLRPVDLMLRMHPRFALGVLWDLVRKVRGSKPETSQATFASVLERSLGRTICHHFYFPYGRKMWGLEPEEISPVQAYKRVSVGSIGKLLRRLVPLGNQKGGANPKGIFYYPRHGYGQISDRLRQAAATAGARISLESTARRIAVRQDGGFEVEIEGRSRRQSISTRHVWSTIPAPVLVRLLDPPPLPEVLASAEWLELRAMVLVYLVLAQQRFSEFDAHYFPETDIPFTRISEPKNYAAVDEPRDRTVLCVELPCSRHDPLWEMAPEGLQELVVEGLSRAGLPVTSPILEVVVRRLPHAYPIYRRGYEEHYERVLAWLEQIDGLLTFGRQGLFVHDNTHHTLAMAHAAVDCMDEAGAFDRRKWEQYCEVFATHHVED